MYLKKYLYYTKLYYSFFFLTITYFLSPGQVKELSINPSLLDIRINTAIDHKVFFQASQFSNQGLIVFIPALGQSTGSLELFSTMAVKNGINVIVLSTSNTNIMYETCEHSVVATCYEDFHRELVEGKNYTPWIEIDSIDGIKYRLLTLLQYLSNTEKTQNWSEYFKGNDIEYGKIIWAGLADGAGRAAVIAKNNVVKRLICFSGPKDFSLHYYLPPVWLSGSKWKTNSANIFAFVHTADDYDFQKEILDSMGLNKFGKAVNVTQTNHPYNNSHILVTSTAASVSQRYATTILDDVTPKSNRQAEFETVWKYLLGVSIQTTSPSYEESKDFRVFPNPIKSGQRLFFQNNKYKYELINTNGKIIQVGNYIGSIEIKVPAGVYTLKIDDTNNYLIKKIVVY